MQVLIDAREKLDIPWEHPSTSPTMAVQIMQLTGLGGLTADQFAKYCPTIGLVWQDRAIKKAYDRRREFQIVIFYSLAILSLPQKILKILHSKIVRTNFPEVTILQRFYLNFLTKVQ